MEPEAAVPRIARGQPGSGTGARVPWLAEPTTTLTDYALAALTAWWAVELAGRASAFAEPAGCWAAAFATTAAAALLGGTVHGFAPRLGEARKQRLWRATLLLSGLTGFFLLAGVANAAGHPAVRTGLLLVAGLKLAGAVALLVHTGDFRFVLYDSGISFLLVLAVQLDGLFRGETAAAGWIVAGVLLSLVGGAVQHGGVRLHRHFNHNDLFHVIQIAAAYLLFRGGMLL